MNPMTTLPAMRRRPQPVPIDTHAVDDLRFIRQTMERAAGLTAFPGWGQVVVGLSALGAAALAMRTTNDTAWLGVWLVEFVLAVVIGSTAMALKARATGSLFGSGALRFFMWAFSIPIVAGGLLTVRLFLTGGHAALPGLWLLLYGAGIAAGGAFSVAAVRAMGLTFMVIGAVALFTPSVPRDLWMAAGFGIVHVVYGVWIARRHGG
jgi:hypothetical protein